MPRTLQVLALALVVVSSVAGCGGDEGNDVARGAVEAHEEARELEGNASKGTRVWVTAGCGACHTLSASRAKGTSGPNLDEVRPSAELVVDRVALGFRGMPTYQGLLTPQQIADLGAYVAEATRR
jgi:alcohol dehydrogenase (cytochrome c)